jgi:hypothetical protein
MKKTFFKGVVATAIVATTMALSSVVAFAATNTYYYVGGNPAVNTSDYFKIASNGTTANYESTFSFTGEDTTYTTGKSYNSAKITGSGITFDVSGTAEAEIIWGVRTDADSDTEVAATKLAYQNDGSNTKTVISDTATKTYVRTTLTGLKGTVTISRSTGKEMRIYGIKLVDTVSDDAKTYTISGTSNATKGTAITVDGNNVTVGADGSWSYTKTVESAPYTDGQKLTVTIEPQTGLSNTEATLSYDESKLTYTANIEFPARTISAIENGTYDSNSMLALFDVTNAKGAKSGSIKPNDGETMKFKVGANKVVSIKFKSGSSSNGKTAKLEVYDETGETLKVESETVTVVDKKSPEAYLVLNSLPEGTYTLKAVASGSSAQLMEINATDAGLSAVTNGAVYVDGTDTYLVAGISKSKLDKSSVKIGFGEKKTFAESDTVYTAVAIGDTTVKASDFDADYLFAVKVEDANAIAKLNDFKVYYAD